MPARLYSRAELEKKFEPYKCKFVAQVAEFVELWETGWGEPYTLCASFEDRYGEEQFRRFLMLVAKTMPEGWNGNGA